jgi:PDDEXK-like domain of unknown function (DUF3799)
MTEATLIWREAGGLTRVRYDTLPSPQYGATYDLKFTGKSAEPDAFGKTIIREHDIQAALYPRAVKALRGDRPQFIFLACETAPPYGVSLHALAPDMEAFANARVDRGLALWHQCMQTGKWPGYRQQIHYHQAPAWRIAEWENAQMQEEIAEEFAA